MSDADYTPDSFVSALVAERNSLQQSLGLVQETLVFAQTMWPRSRQRTDLFQGSEGQVWTKDGDKYILVVRDSKYNFLGPYGPCLSQPATQPTEVKCSRDHFQEEWTWEAIQANDGRTWSTLENLAHEVYRYQRCLDLVNTLLGHQNQVKIWIHDTAQKQGEARRQRNISDWWQLVDNFHPVFRRAKYAPRVDFGQLSAKLSAIMDVVAVGETTRVYTF